MFSRAIKFNFLCFPQCVGHARTLSGARAYSFIAHNKNNERRVPFVSAAARGRVHLSGWKKFLSLYGSARASAKERHILFAVAAKFMCGTHSTIKPGRVE